MHNYRPRRIEARRALHPIALDVATFYPRSRIVPLLIERARDLLAALGGREVRAIVEVTTGPLGPR